VLCCWKKILSFYPTRAIECFWLGDSYGNFYGVNQNTPVVERGGTLLGPYLLLLQPLAASMIAVKKELCGGNQTFVVGRNSVAWAAQNLFVRHSGIGLTVSEIDSNHACEHAIVVSPRQSFVPDLSFASAGCIGFKDTQLNAGLVTKSSLDTSELTVSELAVERHKFSAGPMLATAKSCHCSCSSSCFFCSSSSSYSCSFGGSAAVVSSSLLFLFS